MASVLIDTTVLVYAYDRGEIVKQEQAIKVLEHLQTASMGRISVQALAEFFRATTKGATPILSIEQASQQLAELARTWRVLNLTPPVVLEAARGVRDHQLAYYDAQLWAMAKLNQIPVVFSEDFSAGQSLEGIRFVNPFAPDLVIENWA